MRTGRMFHRDAQTFLVHLFGRGLEDTRYVVEKHPAACRLPPAHGSCWRLLHECGAAQPECGECGIIIRVQATGHPIREDGSSRPYGPRWAPRLGRITRAYQTLSERACRNSFADSYTCIESVER